MKLRGRSLPRAHLLKTDRRCSIGLPKTSGVGSPRSFSACFALTGRSSSTTRTDQRPAHCRIRAGYQASRAAQTHQDDRWIVQQERCQSPNKKLVQARIVHDCVGKVSDVIWCTHAHYTLSTTFLPQNEIKWCHAPGSPSA